MGKAKVFIGVLVLLFLLAGLLGCGGMIISAEDLKNHFSYIVTIRRSVALLPDPKIEILSHKAYFNNKQEVIIEGPMTIRGYIGHSGWVVEKMRIENNKLIILIPKDCKYYVKIRLISNPKK